MQVAEYVFAITQRGISVKNHLKVSPRSNSQTPDNIREDESVQLISTACSVTSVNVNHCREIAGKLRVMVPMYP